MRFSWDPVADAWIGDGSKPGPAGTAEITVGGVTIEFDRVDGGRIVSLIVPANHSAHALLGEAAEDLLPSERYFLVTEADELEFENADSGDVGDDHFEPGHPHRIIVNLAGTRLWDNANELAQLAELTQDAPRLAEAGEHNAAAIAYAELAQALYDLRDLGVGSPSRAGGPLERIEELLSGRRPLVYRDAHDLKDLASHLRTWVPARFRRALDLLAEPRTAYDARRLAPAPAPELELELEQPSEAEDITWETEGTGTFRYGRIEWDGLTAIITVDAAVPAEPWLTVYDGHVLQAEGPMLRRNGSASRRTGPLKDRPTRAKIVDNPYRAPGALLRPLIQQGNELGRRALRLEHRERSWAAAAWRECAESWLAVDETGRAAIALDRAADSALSDGTAEEARRDRERAQALAPAWTWSMIGGRTGAPHRPLWTTAPASFEEPDAPAADRNQPARRTARPAPMVPHLPRAGSPARLLGRGFPTHSKQFVGREQHLRAIESELAEAHLVAVRAVDGTSGVGKSQLVAEYVRRHRLEYDLIAWIDAERPELIADQVTTLLRPEVGGVETPTAQDLLAALDRTSPHWLLIFDNATDPEHLRDWLWRSRSGHMIVTSRRAGWDRLAATVNVDVMSRAEAAQLLIRRAGATNLDDATANDIVEVLHRLPLAVDQAAGYLATTGIRPTDYLELLRAHGNDALPDAAEPGAEPEHRRAVAAVWAVSAADLRHASPAAEQLLQLCSFLGEAPIPLDLFTRHPEVLPAPLSDVATSVEGFNRAVQALLHRSLAQERTGGLAVHRLLAEAVRRPMRPQEREEATVVVRQLLALHLPGKVDREPKGWPTWRSLLPHVLSTTANTGPDLDRISMLLDGAGRYLRAQGQPSAARFLFERALGIKERAHGPNNPTVVADLNNLALLLKDLGRPADALKLLQRALTIDEAVRGPNDPAVADDLNNLAAVLDQLGRPDEAAPLLERALRIDEATGGPQSPQVASDLNQLALVFDKLDQPAKAQRLVERALEIDEGTRGPADPTVGEDLWQLASMLRRTGNQDAARPLLERALTILGASYGYDHPTVKAVQQALGLLPDTPGQGLFHKGLSTRPRRETNRSSGRKDQ